MTSAVRLTTELATTPASSLLSVFDADAQWMKDARCSQADPDAFFPDMGDRAQAARATCSTCPVRIDCLEYAQRNRIMYGIWGGLGEKERARLRTKARRSK